MPLGVFAGKIDGNCGIARAVKNQRGCEGSGSGSLFNFKFRLAVTA
jgi:hypothetical protein